MGVSKNRGTPKSSILIGYSIINHPFWGYPYFWRHPYGDCNKTNITTRILMNQSGFHEMSAKGFENSFLTWGDQFRTRGTRCNMELWPEDFVFKGKNTHMILSPPEVYYIYFCPTTKQANLSWLVNLPPPNVPPPEIRPY